MLKWITTIFSQSKRMDSCKRIPIKIRVKDLTIEETIKRYERLCAK